MNKRKQTITAIAAAFGMAIMILDSKTVMQYAYEGIDLCIRTVIPSLFPFLAISNVITANISANRKKEANLLERYLGLPTGTQYLVTLGLLGGYPSGAQNIYQAYKRGYLGKQEAERLLPVCNNAGPAYIFGVLPALFTSSIAPWVLWAIQILSTHNVSLILSRESKSDYIADKNIHRPITTVLQSAIRNMGYICGWIIIFRIILGLLSARLLQSFPVSLKVSIFGVTEITNGFFIMHSLSSEWLRFIFASAFLSLGGICVFLQTKSVVNELNMNVYVIGKIFHTLSSLAISLIIHPFLFKGEKMQQGVICAVGIFLLAIINFVGHKFKKTVAFREKVLYNTKKSKYEVLV